MSGAVVGVGSWVRKLRMESEVLTEGQTSCIDQERGVEGIKRFIELVILGIFM